MLSNSNSNSFNALEILATLTVIYVMMPYTYTLHCFLARGRLDVSVNGLNGTYLKYCEWKILFYFENVVIRLIIHIYIYELQNNAGMAIKLFPKLCYYDQSSLDIKKMSSIWLDNDKCQLQIR